MDFLWQIALGYDKPIVNLQKAIYKDSHKENKNIFWVSETFRLQIMKIHIKENKNLFQVSVSETFRKIEGNNVVV